MCLSYDTTFEMGDFYVSVLTYRQTEFEEMPVIPLIFMLHMDRLQTIHEFFFSRVAELIPQIAESKNVIIVTDAEKAITNAVSKPGQTFQCSAVGFMLGRISSFICLKLTFETNLPLQHTNQILCIFCCKKQRGTTSRYSQNFI